MLPIERQQAVFEYIRTHHSASVAELSQHFFISETSIRRDLQKLERAGLIRKTYGGAILVQGDNEVISLEARQQVEREAKAIIAKKAAHMVKNGDVIFLDSSSTALSMVPHLSLLVNLSVFTNGLHIANALGKYPQITVYVLGGLLNGRTSSMSGAFTIRQIKGVYANRVFISPKAVDEKGNVYCADEEEAQIRQMMMELSDNTVLLCSHNKLGQHAAFRLCGLNEVSFFICNEVVDSHWEELLNNNNVGIL
ncbi:MAG: DeoR/GlpR family DNA-binding transcription regulator [Christensenellales bacterium]|jgi:DeoR/GlpR family transcriptional regulator of sugar metabolism